MVKIAYDQPSLLRPNQTFTAGASIILGITRSILAQLAAVIAPGTFVASPQVKIFKRKAEKQRASGVLLTANRQLATQSGYGSTPR